MGASTLAVAYLAAAVLFILGLKGLASPRTARAGNRYAMTGMGLAVLATLASPQVADYGWIVTGVAVGGGIGAVLARRVKMTDMPQLVALLHSFVGLAAVLVALGTYVTHRDAGALNALLLCELGIGSFIGAITFTGSVIAFGKLQGLIGSAPLRFAGQHWVNLALALAMLGATAQFVLGGGLPAFVALTVLALLLGVLLIVPIGGADMPVVVSMLNSYSGWAAAATGFTLHNELLIITGALVGASGAILSYIMCRAMNRSIVSVIFGGFGTGEEATAAAGGEARTVKTAAVEDAAFMLENAGKVIIVPGYGLAVAQAQHATAELVRALETRGVEVKFAIHPVAGRMPGHMNVLLAEADIPYDKVFEMEEINPDFATCDVALVLGANDVTNPAAKTDRSSPIYGMPILDVHRARQILFVKRSMKPGYAGVDNALFYQDNCALVFGDAKKVVEGLIQALEHS
ncbi:NAD(P)(+) transhydrogenase (Re/Si-specific) subunit beta [Immundisolibacter sp.]|uniref:NAD(P)(+) transhydrogenase (Re/Si-specific) subunit beta n=1 Tax=Immundisolibacter sp. TaxID=1934948 RepID=UPI002635EC58|nr:NAD(P)(+) transhydrogenase (Re/Si-specific) subunit beta [Immundisolibacter sp.]MDD3650396.1 NAD(P)(+) transhydrogenase (Re/Si-specific) subunit beta [Immundisolibacter sp.]